MDSLKVRATKLGYHDHRRRYAGDVFLLYPYKKDGKVVTPEQQFSKNWMEKVDPSTPELSQPKARIGDGNPVDVANERNQPQHRTIAEIEAEVAERKAAEAAEAAAKGEQPTGAPSQPAPEANETKQESPEGQESTGDSEVI